MISGACQGNGTPTILKRRVVYSWYLHYSIQEASSYLSWNLFLCFVSLPALPGFLLGSSLPCWRPSPPPTSSSHGRWRGHAQWALRHAATRRPAGRWGENSTLAASLRFVFWWCTDMMAHMRFHILTHMAQIWATLICTQIRSTETCVTSNSS